jgi:hypothetical protein
MNTILDTSDQMLFHTDLALVFRALQGRQKEFNWLLTNVECNLYTPELPFEPEDKPRWFTGEELTALVEKHRIQFIWAVLSGFRPEITIDIKNLEVEPRAEGHPTLWSEHPTVEHPKATVELVCCDSSYTILLSKDKDLSQRFRSFFPDAKDLDAENSR